MIPRRRRFQILSRKNGRERAVRVRASFQKLRRVRAIYPNAYGQVILKRRNAFGRRF